MWFYQNWVEIMYEKPYCYWRIRWPFSIRGTRQYKIADKSERVWKTVDEHISEVASDSEDENRIRAADNRDYNIYERS